MARQRTFVVGIDSSDVADRACRWAQAAAGPDDRIIAVHAWTVPSIVMADDDAAIPATQLADFAERGVDDFVRELGDPRVTGVAIEGHAGRAILGEAGRSGADLIVVGHEGSGRASVVLGSTANFVAQSSGHPVVIVRGERTPEPRRVVVGVDDPGPDGAVGDTSGHALAWAAGLPGISELVILHAGDADETGAVEATAPRVPDGVEVHSRIVSGSATEALIEASRDADLVVVGSRGRGGFRGLLLGSTSQALAAHSQCPVAVVR
jgi:nucleotide-binding universal stress UspA family protein